MTCEDPVLRAVDGGLRMLDPNADGQRFRLHGHTLGMQRGEGIARAVADRENDLRGGEDFPAGQPGSGHPAEIIQDQFLKAGFKSHLATELNDFLAQMTHHFDQPVGADVGPRLDQNVLGGTGHHHFLQNPGDAVFAILDLRVELAVGKCSRAPFPELHIGVRLQSGSPPPETRDIPGARPGGFAALDQNRPPSCTRQQQPAEQSAGPGANDHRPQVRSGRGRF